MEKATPVAGGSGLTKEASSSSVASVKRQRSDKWHATRGPPGLSSSGVSSTSSFFMPPPPPPPATEEGMQACRTAIERNALEDDLAKLQNMAHLATMAYEAGLSLWKMRYGKDWEGHRE